MSIIKCKMCGGDLNLISGQSVAECEYCGSLQTVPSADNEKKLTLFARANRLRSACEYDKASGVYESIVAEFPEEAEAYWGLVLCKYGIEYVDDPYSGKKIPTCHRSSFDSVVDDTDYEQTLENADPIASQVYREEARKIEELRKEILSVSSSEPPYDIFICYKETDEHGDRTLDSVLAQDIYDALTEKGYRTFFSRISLEDKLGLAYEPYIFSALHSAKIMLAVGTSYEYYNAVWVKNEWSRFLKLMARGEKKYLIPCYKNLDPYDMPREFARLQSQDLGKIGAIQDLLRGIGKLYPLQTAAPIQPQVAHTQSAKAPIANVTGDSLQSICQLIQRGRKLEAIKQIRENYGFGLKEAKTIADELENTGSSQTLNRLTSGAAPQKPAAQKAEQPQPRVDPPKIHMNTVPPAPKLTESVAQIQNRLRPLQAMVEVIWPTGLLMIQQGGKLLRHVMDGNAKHSLTQEFPGIRAACVEQCSPARNTEFSIHDVVKMDSPYRSHIGRSWGGCNIDYFLTWDGRVVLINYDAWDYAVNGVSARVASWRNIQKIGLTFDLLLGLRETGELEVCRIMKKTVYAADAVDHTMQRLQAECAHDVADFCVTAYHIVVLLRNGTVKTYGLTGQVVQEVAKWNNIVGISYASHHLVGLRTDGTVISLRFDEKVIRKSHNVGSWRNVVAVKAADNAIYAVTADGKILRTMDLCRKDESGEWMYQYPGYSDVYAVPGLKLFDSMEEYLKPYIQYWDYRKQQWSQVADPKPALAQWVGNRTAYRTLTHQLQLDQAELSKATGMFSGGKRKKLEQAIAEKHAKLQALLQNWPTYAYRR